MEIEIKLTVRPTIPGGPEHWLSEVRALETLGPFQLGPAAAVQISDTYFDTPDRALGRARCALRLRIQDGQRLITLKAAEVWTGDGLARREEYEAPLTAAHLAHALRLLAERSLVPRPQLARVRLEDFAAALPSGPLVPILTATTRRISRPVCRGRRGETLMTLYLDRVEYAGITGRICYDLELELGRGGSEADLDRCRQELEKLARGHLEPAAESKLVRGLRLLS